MDEHKQTLESRIESCRDLLDVFQQERRYLLAQPQIQPESILDMLQRKRRLVDSVAEHGGAIAVEAPQPGLQGEAADRRREQIRELASLLERLLVIERENQLLLRKLLAPAATGLPTAAATAAPATPPRPPGRGMVPLVQRLQHIRARETNGIPLREVPCHAGR